MIGIVVVSHSSKVAEGICDMVQQISSRDGEKLPIYPAGGNAQGGLGTDPQRVLEAIKTIPGNFCSIPVFPDGISFGETFPFA